jgi:hypothetical protein
MILEVSFLLKHRATGHVEHTTNDYASMLTRSVQIHSTDHP